MENETPQTYGRRSEVLARYLLERHGRKVEQKEYHSRFDLLIDDKWRCEVKIAKPMTIKGTYAKPVTAWTVNFHRHGELKEDCDFYLIRLEQVPGFKAAIHLVLRAPIGAKTALFTLRSLIENGAPMIDNFKKVCAGEWS